jgi:hypothetical protein
MNFQGKVWILAVALVALANGSALGTPRSAVDWSDSGELYSELEQVNGVPLVTYSRSLDADPEGRLWHIHLHWPDNGEWQTYEVDRGLLDRPGATSVRAVDGGGQTIIHAWRDTDIVRWGRFDVPPVVAIGGAKQFAMPHEDYPVGLAYDSVGAMPIFSFWDPNGVNGAGVYAARWNDSIGNIGPEQHLPDCMNEYAQLQARSNGQFYAACRKIAGAGRDIIVSYEEMGQIQQTVVFGDNDNGQWLYPRIALIEGTNDMVVAAIKDGEAWVRWQEAGVWQAPVHMASPGDGGLEALEVSGRAQDGGVTIGVVQRTILALYFVERSANGTVQARRVDFGVEGAAAPVCQPVMLDVGVVYPDDARAWLSWNVSAAGEGVVVHAHWFTEFNRDDHPAFDTALDDHFQRTTTLVQDEGTPWTCYFDEDNAGVAQYALYVQAGDNAAVKLDGDTSLPLDRYAKGCDISVDPSGRVHVVWGNETRDRVVYQSRDQFGVWEAPFDLKDDVGVIAATSHLALVTGSLGESTVAYQGVVNGTLRACLLESDDLATWQHMCLPTVDAGYYPDLTSFQGLPYALVHRANGAGEVRAALSWSFPGGWVDELVSAEFGWDFSVDARKTANDSSLVVTWARWGAQQGLRVGERVAAGQWDLTTLDDGFTEYTSVKLDSALRPVVTYKKTAPNANGAYLVSYQKYGNGRVFGAPEPTDRFVSCALRTVGVGEFAFGTDLVLDAQDNPRVLHRAQLLKPAANHELQFMSRP